MTLYYICRGGSGGGGGGGGGGGVRGLQPPPNDFEQPLPLLYKAYYGLAQ